MLSYSLDDQFNHDGQNRSKKNFKKVKDAILYFCGSLIGSLLYALYIVGGLRCLLICLAVMLLLCTAFFFICEP